MAIVAGFSVDRAQISFGALDSATGEVMRGRNDAPLQRELRRLARRQTGCRALMGR
jgi:hypothetical protein